MERYLITYVLRQPTGLLYRGEQEVVTNMRPKDFAAFKNKELGYVRGGPANRFVLLSSRVLGEEESRMRDAEERQRIINQIVTNAPKW